MPDIIIPWDGAHASIPAGWTRYTALDGKYPKASSSDLAGTGGSSTHTHTGTDHTHTYSSSHVHTTGGMQTSGYVTKSDARHRDSPPQDVSLENHAHTSVNTGSFTSSSISTDGVTTGTADNEYSRYHFIFIKGSVDLQLPSGSVVMRDNTNSRTGASHFDSMDGRYMKGAGTGVDSGSGTDVTTHTHTQSHSHTLSHNHGSVTSGNSTGQIGGYDVSSSSMGHHTHTVNFTAHNESPVNTDGVTAGTSTLKYQKLHFWKTSSLDDSQIGDIAMTVESTVPFGWEDLGFNDEFVSGESTGISLTSGGSYSHAHSSISHTHTGTSHTHALSTSSVGGSNQYYNGGSDNIVGTHSHTSTTSSASNPITGSTSLVIEASTPEPEYVKVKFIKLLFKEMPSSSKANILRTIIDGGNNNLDQEYDESHYGGTIDQIGNPEYTGGQAFLPTYNNISRAQVWLWREGGAIDDLTIKLRAADDSGNPATVLSTVVIPNMIVPSGIENRNWLNVDFGNVTISGGETHFLTWQSTGSVVSETIGDRAYMFGVDVSSPTYNNGYYVSSDDSESSWTQYPGTVDGIFETFYYLGNQAKANIGRTELNSCSAKANIAGIKEISTKANIKLTYRSKKVFYRVYDGNEFVASWANEVLSEPSFKTIINGGSGDINIKLARNYDDFGEDIDVKLDNIVEVWVSDSENPGGLLMYSGYISGYRPILENSREYVEITVLSFMSELTRYMLRDGSGNTSIAYNSQDPSVILKDIVDKYNADGGKITYSDSSVDLTGTTVSYIFNTSTVREALDKVVELCPSGWYWYVDANTTIHLHAKPTATTHEFRIKKQITHMSTWRRIEGIINRVYFTGGGEPPLYRLYENSGSISTYGLYATKLIDQRVTNADTAQTISNRVINTKKDPEVRTSVRIADSNGWDSTQGYDIESVKVGDTMVIKGLKEDVKTISYWDQMTWDVDVWDQTLASSAGSTIQIQSVTYHLNYIVLEAASRLPEVPKRIEDINIKLQESQTKDNPTGPS